MTKKLRTHCSSIGSNVHSLVRYWPCPVIYIMQFVTVTRLSPCLEASSWGTNDDWYVSKASKNPVFIGKKPWPFLLCQRKLYSPLKQHVCLQREMSLRITIIWLTLSSELYTHCSCISMTCFSESETKVNICNFSFNDLHGHCDCLAVL